ncbi:MAG: trigger factor [Crocinitomicaceae bacterium]|jgi:trigger factor
MNITRQEVDAQNAILKVTILPEDYQGKVKASLEKYRKTAKIPGFRPGHIPMTLIQKQFGRSVLAEELNKLTNDALYKYILDEKLDVLGNPIPKADEGMTGSFEQPENFEFSFEIGYSPSFELPINAKSKFDYATVKIDKDLINKQVEDLRRRYGKLVSSEVVGEKDMVMGKFEEKNSDGSLKVDGINHSTTISMEFLENKAGMKALKGKKVNDTLDLDPKVVSKDDKDCAALLGITEEQLVGLNSAFQFTISDVKRMEMADLNEELYQKLFADEVKTEEELHARISADLTRMFAEDTDRIFTRNVYNHLVEETKMTFPEAFLKRWIQISSEKPVSDEEIAAEFDAYLKSLKWQLIQTRIFKDNNIQLTNQEVIDFTKNLLVGNYAQYGLPAPDDQELTETAARLLQNKEQANGIYDRLAEQKLTDFFKSAVNLVKKEVKYDDFIKLASAQ